jgi:hypothetical protein
MDLYTALSLEVICFMPGRLHPGREHAEEQKTSLFGKRSSAHALDSVNDWDHRTL